MNTRLLSSEVQNFIRDHQSDDPFLLSLHAKMPEGFPLKEAILQIQSMQKARGKLPSWLATEGIIWPEPVSVEQSSSEITARYKANLASGSTLADLTGGMAVDTAAFSKNFSRVDYIEPNKELAEIAASNLSVLQCCNVTFHHVTAEDFLEKQHDRFDWIYIDPSRRSGGNKVFRLEDCSPNLLHIMPLCLQRAEKVLIKLSPMADLTVLRKQLEPSHFWILAVGNEVKEVLCLTTREKMEPVVYAVDLDATGQGEAFSFAWHEENETIAETGMPEKYIYEPSAAILKAGAFKLYGLRYGLKKLQAHSHFYTSDNLKPQIQGRKFRLLELFRNESAMKERISPGDKVHVIARNYPQTADQLKRKYQLVEGGSHYLIATTLADGARVMFYCERVG